MPKKWYKSRTVQIAILTGIIGVVTALQTEYTEVGVLVSIKALLDIALRFITTAPVE